MNKNIFLFFIFFVFWSTVFANEDDALYTDRIAPQIPEITSVNYSWILWTDTIININGTYLDTCSSLKIWNDTVEIKEKSSGVISYAFKSNPVLDGTVFLTCWETNPNRWFEFPFIESVEWIKKDYFDGNITIRWKNFWSNGTVSIDWWSFTINTYTDSIIIGNIPKDIKSWKISVVVDSKTSNTYDITLSIPKITFLYAPLGFTKWNEVFIYWENLYSEYGTFIQYWTTKINKFKRTSDWLSFTLWENIWDKEISVTVNNIVSNSLKANVVQSSPFIKAFWKWRNNTPDSTVSLEVDNLSSEEKDITVFHNGTTVSFKAGIQNNTILLENITFWYWNNFFQVSVNWKKSNVVNIENTIAIPSITWITLWDVENDLRFLQIWVHNYVEWVSKIYIDGGQILPECKGDICKLYISATQRKWSFTIWHWSYINPEWITFDIHDEITPYIQEIKFYDFPKAATQYEVRWSNFLKSSINGSNIFSIIEKDWIMVDDYKIANDNLITARLPYNYASGSSSSINVYKNWFTSNLTFSSENVLWNKIMSAPYIKEFEVKNKSSLFKQNDEINIYWKWFLAWDTLIIDESISVKLIVKNYKESYFIIPSDVALWDHSFYIKNIYWQKSESKSFKISDSSETSNIKVVTEKVESKVLYTNESIIDHPLYTIKMNNNKKGLFLEWLSFIIKWEKDGEILWTFSLSLWGKTYKSQPKKNWILIFPETLYIEPSYDFPITLYKDSDFSQAATLQISLDSKSLKWKLEWKKYTPAVISFWKIETNNFTILESDTVLCIDSTSENKNCKEFLAKKIKQEESKTTPTKAVIPETAKKVETKSTVYTKIDTALGRIYTANSKNTAKKQMDLYKDVKTKIERIILREKNEAKKAIYLYIKESVNTEYKKAFQNYMKSK